MNNMETYTKFARGVLKRVPLLRTEQLHKMIQYAFDSDNLDDKSISQIMDNLQKNRRAIFSSNGWTMTPGYYLTVTDDKYFDGVTHSKTIGLGKKLDLCAEIDGSYDVYGETTIEEILGIDAMDKDTKKLVNQDPGRKDLIDCMWVVTDLMPFSKDFTVTDPSEYPWLVVFEMEPKTDDDTTKTCQIVKFSAGREDSKAMLIRSKGNIEEPDMRKGIIRIAVMDNEAFSWKVPHYGFQKICVIDDSVDSHFRVIEERNGMDAWSDVR